MSSVKVVLMTLGGSSLLVIMERGPPRELRSNFLPSTRTWLQSSETAWHNEGAKRRRIDERGDFRCIRMLWLLAGEGWEVLNGV